MMISCTAIVCSSLRSHNGSASARPDLLPLETAARASWVGDPPAAGRPEDSFFVFDRPVNLFAV